MDSRPYRFATYNCKNVKRSIDSVRELCRSCDLVALQETWLLPEEIPYLSTVDSEFGYTGISAVDTSAGLLRGRPYGGVALLWRSCVFQQVSVLRCDSERICAIKIITSDRPVIVLSVYMPTNAAGNLAEFTDCLSMVSAIIEEYGIESVYILGDFNATPYGLFFNEIVSYCAEQYWICVDVEMLGIDSDTFTFISDVYGSCSWLDHCLVTQSARQSVTNAYVDYDTVWSDHFPLIIECKLNLIPQTVHHSVMLNRGVMWGVRTGEQIALYTSECNRRLRLVDFPAECIQCADSYCRDHSHRRAIDRLYSDIVTALRDASLAGRGSGRTGMAGSRVVGWNNNVGEAHRVARTKFIEWVLCGKPKCGEVYREMCEIRRVFKARLKWCQDHQDQLRMDTLAMKHSNGDFQGFWKGTKKVNLGPGLPVSVDGVSESGDIASLFKSYFSVKPQLGKRIAEGNTKERTGVMETRILASEVGKIIKYMTRGKSPGHDGLSIEHLQYAGPHVTRVLAMFYSLCLSHSYLPYDFMRTVVVPVVKNKTGDLADKTNYRPISLATVIAKVFDGLLDSRLNKLVSLHDNQFGFRPKLSTDSAILCLKHTVRYYTDRKTPVYACFLDLSKAFDLVSYDLLWQKLEGINMPHELVDIFKYWYEHQVNNVRWAGALSEPYRLECGVRQGGLTSPTLFNLYMDALIVALSSRHVGCHVDDVCVNNLSYADDMVVLSASVCGLRKLLDICEEYAGSHGLIYNVAKSQFMVFQGGAKCPEQVPPIRLNGVTLERVDRFKYLGHWVTADLKDHVDIERERRALSKRANMIARRFARCSNQVKIMLFKAFCTSLYTCSLWASYSQAAYSAFRVQYNNAFRAVLGLPRFCSASGMFAEARTDCFHATMRKRCASLVRRASSNTVLAMIAQRLDCPYVGHCCSRHIAVA